MKNWIEIFFSLFFLLTIFFVPLQIDGVRIQEQISYFLFSKLIFKTEFFLGINAIQNIDFSSDSISMLLLLCYLLLISVFITFILFFFKIKPHFVIYYSRVILRYYLIFILLKYGFDKVFKTQFYLPEPNILATPFGNMTRDILFWSTLGTSRLYNILTGITEIGCAFLLLFSRTRILGLILSLVICITIVFINFGFDISVKIYSIFLLMISIFLLIPYLKSIYYILKLSTSETKQSTTFTILNTICICLFLFLTLKPYIENKNFNDDTKNRNYLHGLYKVTAIKRLDKKKSELYLDKIAVHRHNFIIFFDKNLNTRDYYFSINKNALILKDYQQKIIKLPFTYIEKDSTLIVEFNSSIITCKAINWRKLPALNNENHFFIDKVK